MPTRRYLLQTVPPIAILAVAAALRFTALDLRPPHSDEGVNGVFVERILERGYYSYNAAGFHGPLFFYLEALVRRALGFGVVPLRLFSAAIGTATCALPFLLVRRLGRGAALWAAALLAVSPSHVYYSRDAIHEPLLAGLILAAVCAFDRAIERNSWRWASAGVLAIAAAIATKETAVLFLLPFSACIAVESGLLRGRFYGRPLRAAPRPRLARNLLLLAALAGAFHLLLFSGFLRDPRGPARCLVESVRAYLAWLHHGNSEHIKPWWWHLAVTWRYETALGVLALPALLISWRRPAVRTFAIVGLAQLALYSAIPYKTPWLMLNWVVLWVVPVGSALARLARRRWIAALQGFAGAAALVQLASTAHRMSFVRPADVGEPMVYAQTAPDYSELERLLRTAERRLGRDDLEIRLDLPRPWPLPYTLYRFPRVVSTPFGGLGKDSDIIITLPSRRPLIERGLTEAYIVERLRFQPSVGDILVFLRESRLGSLAQMEPQR